MRVCVCMYVCIYVYYRQEFLATLPFFKRSRCQHGSPFSIIDRSQEIFKAISCIGTELLYIGSSGSSSLCSSMWKGPQEYIAYELLKYGIFVFF